MGFVVVVVDISNSLKLNDFNWPCIAMCVHMRMEVELDGCMMYYSTETGGGGGLILDGCMMYYSTETGGGGGLILDGCMMYYSTETGGGGGMILDTPCSVKHESHT